MALLNENPLVILPSLAVYFGLNEAIILQQIHYWLQKSDKVEDGRKWTYNSYTSWTEQFPFWSDSTIKRAITSLEKQGILISSNYNKAAFDKTKWYTIDYDKFQEVTNRLGQNDPTSRSICTNEQVNLTKPIPKTTTEITTETTLKEKNNKKQKLADTDFTSLFSSYTTNQELIETLNDFVTMRKGIKEPATQRAMKGILKRLDQLGRNDEEKIQILENAIIGNWRSVWPLNQKQQRGNVNAGPSTTHGNYDSSGLELL